MAKWGEGDPRWIVEERPDATNVNNWHWKEKNATPWSKERIKDLFKDFKITDNSGIECVITEIDKIDGEATANNRKQKLIFFYEWNIVLKWSGRLPNDAESHLGLVTIPNLSEENDLDDIEITITIDQSNSNSEKLKLFMYNIGRDKIRKQLGTYVKDLKEEYSKSLILPKKENGQEQKPDRVTVFNSGYNKTTDLNNAPSVAGLNIKNDVSVGCKLDVKTLKCKVNFQCRSQELYNVLTEVQMVSAFTNGPAKLDAVKGGDFVLFGGNVHGKFIELVPNEKITQTWRLKQWPAGHFSNVVIKIEEKADHTELELTQTGVPAGEFDATQRNWDRYYFNSIKQHFGFGSFLT